MIGRLRAVAALAVTGLLGGGATAQAADHPMVAMPPGGTAHVGWIDHDGFAPVVVSRRLAPSTALGDPQWISPAGQRVFPADMAADAAGNALVVWKRDEADYAIRARRIAADGSLSAVQVVSGTDAGTAQPQVASAPDGTAVITWIAQSPNGLVVKARRRSPSGALGPAQTLSADGYRVTGTEAVFDSAGNAFVVWRRWTRSPGVPDEDRPAVVQTRRIATGGTLGPVETVSTQAGAVEEPRLGADASGNVIFAWLDSRPVIRRRAADGSYSAAQRTELEADSVQELQLAVAPGGGAIMTWGRSPGTEVIVQARRRAPGGTLGPVLNMSSTATGTLTATPQIAVDPNGNALVAWRREDGPHSRIETRYRRADGTLLAIRDQSGDGQAMDPRLAFDRNGGAVLAWVAGIESDTIQARRKSPSGAWSGVVPVSYGGAATPPA